MASTSSNILSSLGGPVGAAGAGIGLVGAIGSLFGSNGNNNAFKQAQGNADTQADDLGGAQNFYRDQAGQQQQYYNVDNANARDASASYLKFLQTDPYTSGRTAYDINAAKGGMDANIAKSRFSNIARSMGTGGVTNTGGPGSTTSGVDAYLQAQDVLGTNRAQNEEAQAQYTNTGQRLAGATDLTQGDAQTDFGRAQENEGQFVNTTDQQMNFWQDQATQDRSAASAEAGQGMTALGGLGQQLAYGPSMRGAYGNMAKSLGTPPPGGGGYGMPMMPPPYGAPAYPVQYGGYAGY